MRPARRRWSLGMAVAASHCLLPSAWSMPSVAQSQDPPRLACTDWAAAESLAMLGHMPLAVPELAVYRLWMPDPVLPPSTIDLGSRAEPNFEVLSALAPDGIFASSWQAGLLPQFNRIAPTQLSTIFNNSYEPYENIRRLLAQVAQACGLQALTQARLAQFDAALGALREGLESQRGRPVYILVLHESGTQAYIYGPGSWVQTIIDKLGLRNAWHGKTNFYGNTLAGVAALADDPDACILYLDQGPRTRRAEAVLNDSTLWRHIPAVQAGRAMAMEAFFALGGLPSALRCARLVAGAVQRLTEGRG